MWAAEMQQAPHYDTHWTTEGCQVWRKQRDSHLPAVDPDNSDAANVNALFRSRHFGRGGGTGGAKKKRKKKKRTNKTTTTSSSTEDGDGCGCGAGGGGAEKKTTTTSTSTVGGCGGGGVGGGGAKKKKKTAMSTSTVGGRGGGGCGGGGAKKKTTTCASTAVDCGCGGCGGGGAKKKGKKEKTTPTASPPTKPTRAATNTPSLADGDATPASAGGGGDGDDNHATANKACPANASGGAKAGEKCPCSTEHECGLVIVDGNGRIHCRARRHPAGDKPCTFYAETSVRCLALSTVQLCMVVGLRSVVYIAFGCR